MDIDKAQMEFAYNNRNDPKYNRELLGYFEQMADYFAKRFGVKYSDREDLKQEAMMVAVNAIPKYKPSKQSTPFSYFYKVFNVAFMYHLRKTKMKADRRPKTCAIEAFSNLGFEEIPDFEVTDILVSVNGKNYSKSELIEKTKEATKLAKRANKTSNLKLISNEKDDLIREIAYGYIKMRCKKK